MISFLPCPFYNRRCSRLILCCTTLFPLAFRDKAPDTRVWGASSSLPSHLLLPSCFNLWLSVNLFQHRRHAASVCFLLLVFRLIFSSCAAAGSFFSLLPSSCGRCSQSAVMKEEEGERGSKKYKKCLSSSRRCCCLTAANNKHDSKTRGWG